MKVLAQGGLRFRILEHRRVRGEDMPRPAPGYIAEQFTLDVSRESDDAPIDLYPNQQPHPHPEAPNRLTIYWYGREVVLVYEGGVLVGTKRGADFRTRFWPSVLRRVAKARIAAALGKRVQLVSELDIAAAEAGVRALARQRDDGGLRLGSIDDAVRELTGAEPRLARALRRGTTANIDADFDSDVYSGSNPVATVEAETATSIRVGNTTPGIDDRTYRAQIRFPLSSLPSSLVINDVDFQINIVTPTAVDAGDAVNICGYNTLAADDPNTDNATTKFSRSSGTNFGSHTAWNSSGSKTVDLGTTADGFLFDNIDTPDIFSIGLAAGSGLGADEDVLFESIENAGSDPPTLIVDYTAIVTYEQEGYRFRNDDGDEDGATWMDSQDTPVEVAKETPFRLRILSNSAGADPPSQALKLQVRKVGDPFWSDVP